MRVLLSLLVLTLSIQLPLVGTAEAADAHAQATDAQPVLRLATTTSTANSGLLDHILPDFEADSGLRVHVIAVGTGKALRMGRDGDVDVVLVHAPDAETLFVDSGYGVDRRPVMHNDFILVGPAQDPAGIGGGDDAAAALVRIREADQVFVSRGDDSGTHKKELSLWRQAGVTPDYPHYRAAGQGMGKVLQMANELQGYSLTDRGTWLAYRGRLDLSILTEGDAALFNPYSVITVNPTRHPEANAKGARAFSDWLTSLDTCQLIQGFQVQGERLFTPACNLAQSDSVQREMTPSGTAGRDAGPGKAGPGTIGPGTISLGNSASSSGE
jgi:tungstate transport system substrate-binding protein